MQSTERQQIENIRSIHASALKLKQKLLDLLTMIEYQREHSDWPKYLNTLGLCASELVEIRKLLESDRFSSAQSTVLTPIALNDQPNQNLAKATENRLVMFNHDVAPQYLRTKLDPQVESLRVALDTRAVSMHSSPSVSFDRLMKLHEKLQNNLVEEVRRLKQELDHDQERMTAIVKPVINQEELFNMVAHMTIGREAVMRMKAEGSK